MKKLVQREERERTTGDCNEYECRRGLHLRRLLILFSLTARSRRRGAQKRQTEHLAFLEYVETSPESRQQLRRVENTHPFLRKTTLNPEETLKHMDEVEEQVFGGPRRRENIQRRQHDLK
ncbi:hypothetical protein JOB18_016253 [Solea senegalensis]|uniref:Uncharacterized protein n=1 Tax=Solea senegalensis TaxID=28829 RepID=A0AAV6SLA8_SOLSE|nr:hypothetical protein JOB18_016253 [Solea senegalensis]